MSNKSKKRKNGLVLLGDSREISVNENDASQEEQNGKKDLIFDERHDLSDLDKLDRDIEFTEIQLKAAEAVFKLEKEKLKKLRQDPDLVSLDLQINRLAEEGKKKKDPCIFLNENVIDNKGKNVEVLTFVNSNGDLISELNTKRSELRKPVIKQIEIVDAARCTRVSLRDELKMLKAMKADLVGVADPIDNVSEGVQDDIYAASFEQTKIAANSAEVSGEVTERSFFDIVTNVVNRIIGFFKRK